MNAIIYIVGGKKYYRLATISILSMKKNAPKTFNDNNVYVYDIGDGSCESVFSKIGVKYKLFGEKVEKITKQHHRQCKAQIMSLCEEDKFMLIDADTFVQNEFDDFFQQFAEYNVVGIEDGNFDNYLQMAKFMFIKPQFKNIDIKVFCEQNLGVDFSDESIEYPPYFNVGVCGFTNLGGKKIAQPYYEMLCNLSQTEEYNPHDEQLPLVAVLYKNNIQAKLINAIYNYTRSRMKKNKKLGIHDIVKSSVRIIHNRHYRTEADWVDSESVIKEADILLKV